MDTLYCVSPRVVFDIGVWRSVCVCWEVEEERDEKKDEDQDGQEEQRGEWKGRAGRRRKRRRMVRRWYDGRKLMEWW